MASALFGPRDRPLLNLALLGLTLLTTFHAFLFNWTGVGERGWTSEHLVAALSFSLALVLILGTHEMGHYVMARVHRVDTSLPFFIPLPLLGVGTLGAVIRIRGRIPTTNALVDIGAAGPLAGLVVALPVLAYGLSQSTVVTLTGPLAPMPFPGELSAISLLGELWRYLAALLGEGEYRSGLALNDELLFGSSLFYSAMKQWVLGPLGPHQLVVWHPIVVAAWFGLLVTMLNLIPIGQLDGGHIAYAVLGRHAPLVGRLMALGLWILCLFFSVGWLLWLLITTRIIGYGHPAVTYPSAPMSRGRRVVAALCLVAFIGCLLPVPFRQVQLRVDAAPNPVSGSIGGPGRGGKQSVGHRIGQGLAEAGALSVGGRRASAGPGPSSERPSTPPSLKPRAPTASC